MELRWAGQQATHCPETYLHVIWTIVRECIVSQTFYTLTPFAAEWRTCTYNAPNIDFTQGPGDVVCTYGIVLPFVYTCTRSVAEGACKKQ